MFELSDDEFKSLLEYFMKRAGFISYEFDQPVWHLIKRMNEYNERRNDDMDKRSPEIP